MNCIGNSVANLILVGCSQAAVIFTPMIAKKAINPAADSSHHRSGLLESSGHLCSPPSHDDGAPRTPTTPLYGPRYGLFCTVSQSFHPLACIVWQLYGLPAVGGHYGWWLAALPLLQEASPHEPQLRGLLGPVGMESGEH